MANFPNKYTIVLSPLINFIYILYIFKDGLRRIDYNQIILNKQFWLTSYYTILTCVIFQGLANVITKYWLHIYPPNYEFVFNMSAAPVMSVLFSSVNEEIIFRKFIFGYLDRKFGFWVGAVISSLAFAFGHYNYAARAGYFMFAMVMCWSYKRNKTIAIPITAHIIMNILFFLSHTMLTD